MAPVMCKVRFQEGAEGSSAPLHGSTAVRCRSKKVAKSQKKTDELEAVTARGEHRNPTVGEEQADADAPHLGVRWGRR